ncbi:uncharacterized protein LOC133295970 isoform X2 [Gastrolobium bilobum]|uniref:uncharacterized protein LOC133295970 isoform X2 n=1 Tax=Gastrolobium bilobum TaxID=150636 RepID=UPI002AB01272|nr:uncharacterized protein LOC133295970 isoform X2 [Gastrolobium bilobum]
MAAYEGRPLVMEMEREEDFEASGSGCGCGCFRVFSLKWWQGHEEEGTRLLEQKGETWVVDKLKKMKEVSEVIAGPKWKTFIRKIGGHGKKQHKNRFQYDEHSYALNFNSGAQSEDEDMPPSFSARFSAPGRRQNES